MNRQSLPNRRYSENVDFEHESIRYTATVGYSPETHQITEMFVTCCKIGSGADSAARDAAIAVSLALQHGADITRLRAAMSRNEDGSASSPIGRMLDILASG